MPPLDGAGWLAVAAGAPPPPLRPLVALADMVMIGWVGMVVAVGVVGKVMVLVDAMVSPGVGVL